MEFENEDFSVIVPDYLINENEAASGENEAAENEAASEENEAAENEAASEENEAAENEAASGDNEAAENEAASEEIDYSSILQEMNSRLENIEANTVDYTEGINGLLANLYFIDFVSFAVFVFLMLFVVIKFFKQFF